MSESPLVDGRALSPSRARHVAGASRSAASASSSDGALDAASEAITRVT